MKVLRISLPGAPQNYNVEHFLDSNLPLLKKWQIVVNPTYDIEVDAWCVVEGLTQFDKSPVHISGKLFFCAAETAEPIDYLITNLNVHRFLDQFDEVHTFHQFNSHKHRFSIPFLPWWVDANHGDSIWKPSLRDFNYFQSSIPPEKVKTLSVICSDKTMTPGHRLRLKFVEYLDRYFSGGLDWFGNGISSIESKWDGLSPYKYTVVLENHSRRNVITEKLGDAFLCNSFPFYWGAPNISDYYDSRGLREIEVSDLEGSLRLIERTIEANVFENSQEFLKINRIKTIGELNWLHRILEIAESGSSGVNVERQILIHELEHKVASATKFASGIILLFSRISRFIKRLKLVIINS